MIKKVLRLNNYGVDEKGNVYNITLNPPRKMKTYLLKNGYESLTISENNKRYKLLVHRLIAEAFVPNTNNYSDVDHIDNDRKNNVASNLRWCTRSENIKKAYEQNRMPQCFKPEYIKVFVNNELYYTGCGLLDVCKKISNKLNVSYSSLVKYGKSKNVEIVKCNDYSERK